MSDDLLKLAERAEAATGPDDALDQAIYSARFPGEQPRWVGHEDPGYYWRHNIAKRVPAYTASLDAAMTLVPEGMFVTLIRDPSGISYAAVAPHPEESVQPYATAPLAIVGAALRARARSAA